MRSWFVIVVLAVVLAAQVASAQQQPGRLWYRGAFDGYVDIKQDPAYGYYYKPSPNSAYPLNEAAYGQPIPCKACGHRHLPGQDRCATCGRVCPAGGNHESPNTVYSRRQLPGMYFYEKQPHYTFVSPARAGWLYEKYTQPID